MSSYQRWYRAGTISVANGSTAVTGALTAWLANARAGDTLVHLPSWQMAEVASVETNTGLTLGDAWPGATVAGGSYAIMRSGPSWGQVADVAVQFAALIDSQTDIFSGSGVPSNELGADGSIYIRTDVPMLYKKANGAWDSGVSIVGPIGPVGPGFAATSTTSIAIGTGSKALTVGTGLAYSIGMRVRATASTDATKWMEGVVTAYTGGVLTFTADLTNGTGTFNAWSINTAGERGATGATGASYAGTSATSLAIGTGSKVFATQAGLAYVVGSRARAASSASPANFMEGVVTAYSGASLTVNVDLIGGTGTFAAWNLSLAGERGTAGLNGGVTSFAGRTGVVVPAAGDYAVADITGLSTALAAKAPLNSPSFTGDVTGTGTLRWGKAVFIGNTDLNALHIPGFYDGNNFTNSPDGTNQWFYVLVQAHSSYSPTWLYVVQTAWHLGTGGLTMYIRRSTGSTGTWSAWTEVLTTGNTPADNSACDARLTLVSGTPVMTTSQTAKTTLYMTPFKGNRIALWNGSSWSVSTFAEVSASLSALAANTNYDVFAYSNSGALTLELVAWTNATSRATALAYQNGVLVKSGAPTRRYIGTIMTTATAGQCEFSFGGAAVGGSPAFLGVWNYYNRSRVSAFVSDTVDSFTYSAQAWGAFNASNGNRITFIRGVNEDSVSARSAVNALSSSTGAGYIGIGVDSASVNSAQIRTAVGNINQFGTSLAEYAGTPSEGAHYLQLLAYSQGGTVTFSGDQGTAYVQQGFSAELWM